VSGAERIGALLAKMGYEQVFYFSPPLGKAHGSLAMRLKGLRNSFTAGPVHEMIADRDSCYQILERVRKGELSKTAFVASSDTQALPLLYCANRLGLDIPGDLGLVSLHILNNWESITYELKITGITYDLPKLGAVAGGMALEKIQNGGKPVDSILLPERFVEGNSIRAQ